MDLLGLRSRPPLSIPYRFRYGIGTEVDEVGYRQDLWEIAATRNSVVTVVDAEDAGVPAVELRKLAGRGALRACGHGVYVHRDVPMTPLTEPTIAVALAGDGSFLHRESVPDLLGFGQFNPLRVRVGTHRRVRRTLPDWMELESRSDVPAEDLTHYEGVPTTTIRRSLADMRTRMPPDRWVVLVDDARRRELISDEDAAVLAAASL